MTCTDGDDPTSSLVAIECGGRGIGDDGEALNVPLGESGKGRCYESLSICRGQVGGVEGAVLLVDDAIDDP